MRILMVSRGVVPLRPGCGGAELMAYELARSLGRGEHHVTLVSDASDRTRDAAPEVRFEEIGSRLAARARALSSGVASWIVLHFVGNLTAAFKALRLLRRGDFDLVHAHGSLSALLLTRFAGVPVVYTEHDAPPWHCRYRYWPERLVRTVIYRVLNVAAWRRADGVGVTFESLAVELVDRWGVSGDRVTAIANATDADLFHPTSCRRGEAAEPAEPASPSATTGNRRRYSFDRYCLFVGRLTPRKAPDLLLDALSQVPDVCCLFVGDGPMRARLERLAQGLDLGDRVVFLGSVEPEHLAAIYAGADLLVLPSVSEASPLVAVEAMACGTPVLATRIAGVPAVVADYETGFLVKPGDVGALAVALRFLTRDHGLLDEMSQRAQQRARERFVWPIAAQEYRLLYQAANGSAVDYPKPGVRRRINGSLETGATRHEPDRPRVPA